MRRRIGWRAIARYVAGESSRDEAAAIEACAQADVKNTDLLSSVQRAWSSAEADASSFDTERAWRSLSGRIAGDEGLPLPGHTAARPRRRRMLTGGLLAAGIAIALLVPLLRDPAGAATKVYATGDSNVATVHLDDGSVVRLAPNSELKVDPAGGREAWLEGTGFFAIAERNGEPFVVHTTAGDARVLGTRFELTSAGREVRLVVFEGRVALTAKGTSEIVEAGQLSRAEQGQAPSAPQRADVQATAPWMRGVLIFQATPLRTVASEIEQQFGRRVRVLDDELAGRTVSAVFENQALETVVAAICRVADASCEVQDTVILIKP